MTLETWSSLTYDDGLVCGQTLTLRWEAFGFLHIGFHN